jgi:hypothetical protein
MTIPGGWLRCSDEIVSAINEEAAGRGVGNRVRFVAAFQYENSESPPYPYVLLQLGNESPRAYRGSYKELQQILVERYGKIRAEAERSLPDLVEVVSLGTPVLDMSRARFLQNLSGVDPQLGHTKGISIGFIGSRSWVFLHCYALEGEFSQNLGEFEKLAETFQWDPGYSFVASEATHSRAEKWMAEVIASCLVAAFGGKKLLDRRNKARTTTA